MSRAPWTSVLAFVLSTGGCSHAAPEPTSPRVRESRAATPPSAAEPPHPLSTPQPSTPAPNIAPLRFSDKLRWISQHFGSDLTPTRVAAVLGGAAQSTTASRWSVQFEGTSEVEMQADGLDAAVRWLEFDLARDHGLRFAELLLIYGDSYRKVEGTKHGTDIFFDPPTPGSAQPGTRVAARLSSRVATPDAGVVELHLLRDSTE